VPHDEPGRPRWPRWRRRRDRRPGATQARAAALHDQIGRIAAKDAETEEMLAALRAGRDPGEAT
jgi:hypothetical protein